MKILYISTFINDATFHLLNKSAQKGISVSANKYAFLIRKGLEECSDIDLECIYSPSIGDYSLTGIKNFKAVIESDSPRGIYLSCLNYPIIKQISISLGVFVFSLCWLFRNFFVKKKIVVMSSIQLPFLLGLLPIKLFFVKTALFVPDLPIYQYNYTQLRGRLQRLLLPLYQKMCKGLYNIISYYIFITKYMVDEFPKRPYTIMEGLVDCSLIEDIKVDKFPVFTIMYAGALYESMGINLLLDAVKLIPRSGVQVLFFGKGDMVSLIEKTAETDKRIIYGGVVTNNEILELEKRVHLLVNPRPTVHEYTKYSFPSKLMEYMLSGTPVLTTRLAGISECYNSKMYFIDDETPVGIKNAIETCMKISETDFMLFGKTAKEYVMSDKNYIRQIDRVIFDMNKQMFSN